MLILLYEIDGIYLNLTNGNAHLYNSKTGLRLHDDAHFECSFHKQRSNVKRPSAYTESAHIYVWENFLSVSAAK